MATQSAINRVEVPSSYTTSSPLSVPASEAGPARCALFTIRNVGISRVLIRGKAGSNATSWIQVESNHQVAIQVQGAADNDAVSLEFARTKINPRFINIHSDKAPIDVPAHVEVIREQ